MKAWRKPGARIKWTEDGLAEPWPARHDAFLMACALFAGQREKDLLEALTGLAGAGG